MKRAVSISLGSSERDKSIDISMLGEKIRLERIGTDGDLRKAQQLFKELDGVVDALGVGGAVLGLMVAGRWFPFHSVLPMVADVQKTPVVDGTGLKLTLEAMIGETLQKELGHYIKDKKVLIMNAVDRWGLAHTFVENSYQCVFGDLIFSLGLPMPIRTEQSVIHLANAIIPLLSRLPFRWVYPIGEEQHKRTPRTPQFFQWATVIAGDMHYISKYMPDDMQGKIVVTNTTTLGDVALLRKAGVKYLVTTTPVYDGRSFGTNVLEAAIVALSERKDPVNYGDTKAYFATVRNYIEQIGLTPQIQEL